MQAIIYLLTELSDVIVVVRNHQTVALAEEHDDVSVQACYLELLCHGKLYCYQEVLCIEQQALHLGYNLVAHQFGRIFCKNFSNCQCDMFVC